MFCVCKPPSSKQKEMYVLLQFVTSGHTNVIWDTSISFKLRPYEYNGAVCADYNTSQPEMVSVRLGHLLTMKHSRLCPIA